MHVYENPLPHTVLAVSALLSDTVLVDANPKE